MALQLRVTAGDDAELAADRLWRAGAVAVLDDGGVLRAGFADDVAARTALDALGMRWPCELEAVDVSDDEWRRATVPVRVGRLLVTLPEHRPAIVDGTVIVEIEPGSAFGSGAHATTRQCLRVIEAVVGPGMSVLDVGSGTGVLAIAAARLGGGPVVAVDSDPVARAVSAANAAGNGAEVTVVASIPHPDRFDLVVCNLGGSRTVLELAGELERAVAPGGRLVVAGLLGGANDVPTEAFAGLRLHDRADLDGWFALTFARPPAAGTGGSRPS